QDMYRGIKRAAILADDDSELDAVCVTGSGEWFCVGGDMSGRAENPEALAAELDPTDHFPFRHFERCSKVIVAAVNGQCHAGGLNLLMHCDLSIAVDTARFRAPELLRGIPDPYMSARLADYVGLGKAKYLLFTAALIDAREAESMGLIGKVVTADRFQDEVEWTLEQIRKTAPGARALIKEDCNKRLHGHDVSMFRRSIMSPEMVEGMQAFLEKRPPDWPRG
ncbi:enoyl-CoA hydratase/isomerase family protein, partial [Myxococcota bacterium]|nr:enoyl-CoA hydratase/isomerase family protein [Myxococcota bacterium]